MQLEVCGPVAQGKVVLGHFGLGSVKGHLVAGQPAFIAQDSVGVNDGTLQVHVAAQVYKVPLVARLQFAALLSDYGWLKQSDHEWQKTRDWDFLSW